MAQVVGSARTCINETYRAAGASPRWGATAFDGNVLPESPMQRIRRRTEITVETEEILVRHAPQIAKRWCPECATEVSVATPEVASAIMSGPVSRITQGIQAGHVHSAETPDGHRLVCMRSLLQWTAPAKKDDPPA